MPSEVSVTPSCIAAMKRGGSPVIRSTLRARRSPWWWSSMILVRLAVTSPYSAATKKAFSRISAATPRSSRKRVTPSPPRGAGTRRYVVHRLARSIGDAPVVLVP